MKRQREAVTRESRNYQRRRQTLLGKAAGISDRDLEELVTARAVARAKAKAKAAAPKPKAKAKAKAKAKE